MIDDARERGRRLISEALRVGFDDAAIVRADTVLEDIAHLDAAFATGRFDIFPWMKDTLDQRRDVRVRMPSAQSVLVVVQSYFVGDHADHATPAQLATNGKVARYAWGSDYHQVLRRRLRKLRKFALGDHGGDGKVAPFLDSDAVCERAWAKAAGLGFTGKSSLFIHRQLGTWTFLGGLLSSIDWVGEATPHVVMPQMCGSCTACLDACPTGAIIADNVVDPTRCITTFTVEEPTSSLGDFVEGLGWAVGCDVCQEVCPWNKFAKQTSEPRFQPIHVMLDPDALPTAETVAGTPLARPGAENLVHLTRRAVQPSQREP
jgi:epoxyqueuosine reductase